MAAHHGILTGDKFGLTIQEGGYFHQTSRKKARERIETMNESGITVEDDALPYMKVDLSGSGVGRPSFAALIAASANPGEKLLYSVKETEDHKLKSSFQVDAEIYENDA